MKRLFLISLVAVFALSMVACSGKKASLTGNIKVDGSSTVYPITQAIAEEFKKANPDLNIAVGTSGTGGGFKKFVVGETDINDASRKVKDEEAAKAKENNIEMLELEVAYDGIAVVVNKDNTWVSDITVEELKKIWEPNSTVKLWSDVRPEWPKEPIKLYGPGTDSGTFDYFTEKVNGKEKAIRTDFTASEDDNVLVQGVAGDKYAMGYFGLAYFEENADKIKALKINGVEPTVDTVKNGTYKPLSRPLYIYVANKSLERPEVKEFVKFYLEKAKELVTEVGYIPLEDSKYQDGLNKIK
ncbi:phosphate ABC transporter substrate-binding protein [Fervidicella metallireducens AeB]|uniref:Phosphate-binding protein n=1 Tax=Fervidicella metallireducens AeB TaxID=1403537 RepID=A0A017RWE1_9CLOT|nr:phosphate ABC transporter substrate-binding protein [Fervidicella metallireducens AeB]